MKTHKNKYLDEKEKLNKLVIDESKSEKTNLNQEN